MSVAFTNRCVVDVNLHLAHKQLQYTFDWFPRRIVSNERRLTLLVLIIVVLSCSRMIRLFMMDCLLSNRNGKIGHHQCMSLTMEAGTMPERTIAAAAILA